MPKDFPSLQSLSVLKSSNKKMWVEVGDRREEAVLTWLKNPDLISAHSSTLCWFPQQQVELASEMGCWELSLLQNFFQKKPCLQAWILLLHQGKTAPGGCWLAGSLQCPKPVTTNPRGRCPLRTNLDNVSADKFFPSEGGCLMLIQICYHSYFQFGHLPSGITHNCPSNNSNRR